MCSAFENHMICFAILRNKEYATIYSDPTERFLVDSYTGINYMFCLLCLQIKHDTLAPDEEHEIHKNDNCMQEVLYKITTRQIEQ